MFKTTVRTLTKKYERILKLYRIYSRRTRKVVNTCLNTLAIKFLESEFYKQNQVKIDKVLGNNAIGVISIAAPICMAFIMLFAILAPAKASEVIQQPEGSTNSIVSTDESNIDFKNEDDSSKVVSNIAEITEYNSSSVASNEQQAFDSETDSIDNLEIEDIPTEGPIVNASFDHSNLYGLTNEEIDVLVQAVQHETNSNPNYYVYGDLDTVQQLMTACIVNRIGKAGFGSNYTTANNLYEVLANPVQYGNILNELQWFDPNEATTRANVMAVLTGAVYVPDDLYFERCSSYGESAWLAQANFEGQYNTCYTYYMAETWEAKDIYGEGIYIMFGCNPGGAY